MVLFYTCFKSFLKRSTGSVTSCYLELISMCVSSLSLSLCNLELFIRVCSCQSKVVQWH